MKLVFVGYAVPASLVSQLSGVSIAGNRMQLGLIRGLSSTHVMGDLEVAVCTLLPIASFPQERRVRWSHQILTLDTNLYAHAVSFINLPPLKQVSQAIGVIGFLRRTLSRGDILLTFNAFPPIGIPAVLFKALLGARFIPILADLPIDDAPSRGFSSRMLRAAFDFATRYAISAASEVIALNQRAVSMFAPKARALIVDGAVEETELNRLCALSKTKRNVVYTGALTPYSGVLELIAAMKLIDDEDICLDVFGHGPLASEVARAASASRNVTFWGRRSHEDILRIQSEAYLLINPRPTNDPIASVTFPSKIFEYMLSGTPVLSTRLNGLTSDFSDKLYFCDDNNPLAMAERIREVMKLPEANLRATALRAYLFVAEQRTWARQAARIASYIRS